MVGITPETIVTDEDDWFEKNALEFKNSEEIDPEETSSWLSENSIDLDSYQESNEPQEVTWGKWIKDVAKQSLSGAAKAFSWPLDILKLAMLGEGLSDIEELEEAHKRAGIPFDRDEYIKNIYKLSEFVPTQELLEKGIEHVTGETFEAETEAGKKAHQFFNIATFGKGGVAKRLASGGLAVGTTEALKQTGVPEPLAELGGDITGLTAGSLTRKAVQRELSKESAELQKIADKHNLPFWEGIAREEIPKRNVKVLSSTENSLKKNLNMSVEEAINNVMNDRLTAAKLVENGANLDAMITEGYEALDMLASQSDAIVSTEELIKNIDRQIENLSKVPSPSDANRTAISILKRHKRNFQQKPDIEKLEKFESQINAMTGIQVEGNEMIKVGDEIVPKSEALAEIQSLKNAPPSPKEMTVSTAIEQYKELNKNLTSIYKRSEFSGREDAIRYAYEDLKNSLNLAIEKSGAEDVARQQRKVNKLYSQSKDYWLTQSILDKAIVDGAYNGKKLESILNSSKGNILKRTMGEEGVNELKDIARFEKTAQKKVIKLIESSQAGQELVEKVGILGPMILYDGGGSVAKASKKAIGGTALIKNMSSYARGYFLTRPATRKIYKTIVENAARSNFKAMAEGFDKLNEAIEKDFGSLDNFIQVGIDELEIWSSPLEDAEEESS